MTRFRRGVFVLSALAFSAWACTTRSPTTTTDGADSGADASDDADSESTCPQDLPTACPEPAPSYARDIVPILERRCFACHADGGIETKKHDFGSYDAVFAQRSPILNQVYACLMPPPDASALMPDERAGLLGWFVCHAPNN